jgi:hypothetical protein
MAIRRPRSYERRFKYILTDHDPMSEWTPRGPNGWYDVYWYNYKRKVAYQTKVYGHFSAFRENQDTQYYHIPHVAWLMLEIMGLRDEDEYREAIY